jgi:hypothetical protein
MPVDKLRVVHPTDATRRVDDALPIRRCGYCRGCLLVCVHTPFLCCSLTRRKGEKGK